MPQCVLTNTAGEKMKKILVAVDDTKGTKNAFEMYTKVCNRMVLSRSF